MSAAIGCVASRSTSVVLESDPWCPTLRTSIGESIDRCASAASTGASASPVRRAVNPANRSSTTTEALLMSPSGSGARISSSEG